MLGFAIDFQSFIQFEDFSINSNPDKAASLKAFEGRAKVYEAIVKGQVPEEPGLPESFNVLVRELQALGLDVELLQQDDE